MMQFAVATFLRRQALFLLILAASFTTAAPLAAQDKKPPLELPDVFKKKTQMPENVADLKAMQDHVAKVVERVMPAVVSVRVGQASGSAVIVSKDGYMLTAGHVSGAPGQDVTVFFHDGKKAKAKTLGGNHGIDSGMMKITTEGPWPFCEMGNSSEIKAGQWCMVCAHPSGYKPGRTPPVRLGRLTAAGTTTLVSECILVGGDSGGPLFDMHGRVIGINSRIGENIAANMHVPVNPFKDSWERLAAGEVFGNGRGAQAYIGIAFNPNGQGCVVQQVEADSPASKAGLKVDDLIVKMDGKEIDSGQTLALLVRQRRPGTKITLAVQRGEEMINLTVQIGKRQ